MASNYGISAENFKLSAVETSGFARMIAKERIIELRQEQIKNFRQVEAEVFDSQVVAHTMYELGVEIPRTAQFSIDYPELRFPSPPMEELAVLEKEMSMGLTNMLEVVKQRNPDIKTDEQAEEYISKNIAIRNRINNKFGGTFSLGSSESADADE